MPRRPYVAAVLLLGALAACSGGGGGGPAEPNGPNGPNGPNTPNNPGDGVARVVLTIAGLVGTERDMTVRYVIADAPTSRAAAAAIKPTPFGCFSDVDPVCVIDVPVGKRISLFAIEGEGVVAGDAGTGRPVPPPDPLRHEFLSFVGDCETQAVLGECVLHVTADKQYNVRAEFAQMQLVVFQIAGAGQLEYGYTARDRLHFPNRPYLNTAPGCCGGGGIYVAAAPVVYAYLPTGSTVTATRRLVSIHSDFIQWDGPCTPGGGIEASCTQVVGPTPTPTATAVFYYYDCGSLGTTAGGTGPNPPANCTKTRPQ